MRRLDPGSIHCVVTSPPYWGLRDYDGESLVWGGDPDCAHEWGALGPAHHPGQVEQSKWRSAEAAGKGQTAGSGRTCLRCDAWQGQLGLEPTPQMYVQHLVEVFRAVRSVLRDDGTAWLNLGDSYARGRVGRYDEGGMSCDPAHWTRKTAGTTQDRGLPPGLKEKDLVGIPWRVAFALQDDGWYLRSDIVWNKANPLPESVTDRVTKSHEYIFMLTKRPRYFYDAEAIKEPLQHPDFRQQASFAGGSNSGDARPEGAGGRRYSGNEYDAAALSGRNKRSVWTMATRPYRGAHFAVFPPDLIAPCVLAGTSEKGCCPLCGAPWVRTVDRERVEEDAVVSDDRKELHGPTYSRHKQRVSGGQTLVSTRAVGESWDATCGCPEHVPVPCRVLDPFSGSGTTGMVALDHGRDYVGLDVNASYVDLAVARLLGEAPPPRDAGEPSGGLLEMLASSGTVSSKERG